MAEVKAVVLRTNGKVSVENIETYDMVSSIVEGYIEYVGCEIDGIAYDIIINEEGKLSDLKISALWHNGYTMDTLRGNIVISKHDGKGEQVSLTEAEIQSVTDYIKSFHDAGLHPIFKM